MDSKPPHQPQHLPRRNLPLLFLQARESVFSRFRPILNSAGITEQQWRVVRALLDNGPLEQRRLGQVCQLSNPSLAGILARMEQLGYVARERLDHDQRRVKVSVTGQGEALAAQLAPTIGATYRALEEELGVELAGQLYATLDAVIARLGEAPAGEDAGG